MTRQGGVESAWAKRMMCMNGGEKRAQAAVRFQFTRMSDRRTLERMVSLLTSSLLISWALVPLLHLGMI